MRFLTGIILVFVLLLNFDVRGLQAKTLMVGNQGSYSSITQALNAAQNGDVVIIGPGTYKENPVVTKPLTIKGQNWPVLIGRGEEDVLTLHADKCQVEGMVIRQSGLPQNGSGIKVLGNSNIIRQNRLYNVNHGIDVWAGDLNVFSGNVIVGCLKLPETSRGNGIYLQKCTDNKAEKNQISYFRDGIYLSFAKDTSINENVIFNLRYGVHSMYSDGLKLAHNRFAGNKAGPALMYTKDGLVEANFINRNRGLRTYGLLLKACDDTRICGNLIVDNSNGFFIDTCKRLEITENEVKGNGTGLLILPNSEVINVYGNNLIENLYPVKLTTGSTSFVRWNNDEIGNYWSDYQGYDFDGDGKGDTPYESGDLYGYLVEEYPQVAVLGNSSVFPLLKFMTRLFPFWKEPKIIDKYPLMKPIALPIDKAGVNLETVNKG